MIFHKSMTKGMLTNKQRWRRQEQIPRHDVLKNFMYNYESKNIEKDQSIPYKTSYKSENTMFEFYNKTQMKPTTSERSIFKKRSVRWSREAQIILVPCIEEYKSAGIVSDVWSSDEEIKEIQMNLANEIINHKDYDKNITLTENFKSMLKNRTIP